MSRSRFFRFADRIINIERIVAVAPPTIGQHGYELVVRLDGELKFSEDFPDQPSADLRFAELEQMLVGNGAVLDLTERLHPSQH